MSKIFISYADQDKDLIDLAIKELERTDLDWDPGVLRAGLDNVIAGSNLREGIREEIRDSSLFILFWSKRASLSYLVQYEVGIALALNLPINVVLLEGTVPNLPDMPDGSKIIATRHFRSRLEPSSSETLFIGCSWEKTQVGKWRPNQPALQLQSWLDYDFGSKSEDPLIGVNLMDGRPGERFSHEFYRFLDETTFAIILMTADILVKDESDNVVRKYAKPNVYHEIGYLMNRLGEGRVVVLLEEGVERPSNIHDAIFIPFDRTMGGLALVYDEIIDWIAYHSDVIRIDTVEKALAQHLERVKRLSLGGVITAKSTKAFQLMIQERLATQRL